MQDGSYNAHLLCSKRSQLNVELTIGNKMELQLYYVCFFAAYLTTLFFINSRQYSVK
jgi:hypothetical protein